MDSPNHNRANVSTPAPPIPPQHTIPELEIALARLKVEAAEQRAAATESHHRIAMLSLALEREKQSKTYRLTTLVRRLLFRPRHYSLRDLIPGQQVRADIAPTAWISAGDDPQFLLACDIPAGWMRVQLELSTSARHPVSLFMDTDGGFDDTKVVQLGISGPSFKCDLFCPLPKRLRALRLDPLDAPGPFELKHFSVRPVSAAQVYARAFLAQWKNSRAKGYLGLSIKKAAALLAKGDVRAINDRVISRYPQYSRLPGAGYHGDYEAWLEQHRITPAVKKLIDTQIASFERRPLISVILPTYNTPEDVLRAALDSVRNQLYPDWELCIADDHSSATHVRKVLEEYAAADPRIKVTFRPDTGNISAATNSALALATGEFAAFLDHDDLYAPHALFSIAKEILAHPDVDMIYSDEDKITPEGKHVEHFFKPDWSPDFFLSCMYTCHLSCYRTSLVRDVGGLRSEYDGAQDYDLALRIVARTQNIRHIPDVLYHWRMLPTSTAAGAAAKPHAFLAAQRAIASYLQETDQPGTVEAVPNLPGTHRVRYHIRGNPMISIVIPSACRPIELDGKKTWFLLQCVRSIRELTTYQNIEILVVDNNDMSPELAAALKPYNVINVPFTDTFNLAAKMNLGAHRAKGDYVLFLNDDIEVISPDWLETMLGHAQQKGVGAVGARLLFPTGNLQHVGVIMVPHGPDHISYNHHPSDLGYFFANSLTRNAIAVTGACVLMKMEHFHLINGWNTAFPLNFNDVDLCLRLLDHNLRIVMTPFAELRHHESVSKTGDEKAMRNLLRECEVFMNLWRDRYPPDPWYNINLTQTQPYYHVNTAASLKQKLLASTPAQEPALTPSS